MVDEDVGIVGERFFQGFQLPLGTLVGDLIAFALHGVLGTLERKALLMENAAQLVVADRMPVCFFKCSARRATDQTLKL